MSGDGYYKRALEILSRSDVDYRYLVYKIAITRPSALVYIIDGEPIRRKKNEEEELKTKCLSLLRAGKKIEAIKEWRYATNIGLREAKDAVEALATEHGIYPNT